MRRVIRGKGIKFLDEDLEAAAFRILIGVYIHLVHIEDIDDLDEVLFVFKQYIYREYKRLYIFLKNLTKIKHYDTCNCMDTRLEYFKKAVEGSLFIAPSELLGELDHIKRLTKMIQEASCLPWIKLK
jgi:hypothetical protein